MGMFGTYRRFYGTRLNGTAPTVSTYATSS